MLPCPALACPPASHLPAALPPRLAHTLPGASSRPLLLRLRGSGLAGADRCAWARCQGVTYALRVVAASPDGSRMTVELPAVPHPGLVQLEVSCGQGLGPSHPLVAVGSAQAAAELNALLPLPLPLLEAAGQAQGQGRAQAQGQAGRLLHDRDHGQLRSLAADLGSLLDVVGQAARRGGGEGAWQTVEHCTLLLHHACKSSS